MKATIPATMEKRIMDRDTLTVVSPESRANRGTSALEVAPESSIHIPYLRYHLDLVEITPEVADVLGIADGEGVRVISRRGVVTAKAKVVDVSLPGVVSMTFHMANSPTNALTSSTMDQVAGISETKVCAVRMEELEHEIIRVLERASEDDHFIARLTEEGSRALAEYNLTSEEKAALVSGDIRWIEKHIGKLKEHQKRWLLCRLEQEIW